ncbi:hypothetical protein BH11BAC2_BH11BAC2_20420 [soil metagenome]
MKKVLLSLFALFGSLISANASHMMGGQITVAHQSGMDYTVTYTAYRDMTGIPIATTAMLTFTDSVSGSTFYATIVASPPDTLIPGVEQYTYEQLVTFPSTGTWFVSYSECCRNAAILNFPNPSGYDLLFYSKIEIDTVNSSPEFLNPPVILGQMGIPFYYNPLPFDVDGDSIAWQLDVPLSSGPIPVAGYTLPSSDSLVPFQMDPVTGEITFLPNTLGHFEVSVRVQEFRNGVQIGEISRDMQIIIEASGNRPVILTSNASAWPYSGKNFTVAPASGFTYTLTINDPDNNIVEVSAAGEPFLYGNAPTFNTSVQGANTVATLNWTPTQAQARTQPYIIGLRVAEVFGTSVYMSDVSLSLRVGINITGINSPQLVNGGIGFYPNPAADGNVTFQINASSTNPVSLKFYNLSGQVVKEIRNVQVALGENAVLLRHLDLPSGAYLIQTEQEGSNFKPVRLIIQ